MARSLATALAISAAAIAGCTKRDVTTIDLSDRGSEIAFVALLDELDRAVRVTQPFGVEQGVLSFGERPQLQLNADEAAAVLIELDRAAFMARHPDFVAARAPELRVALAVPPASDLVDGSDLLRITKNAAIDPDGTEISELLEVGTITADSPRGRNILAQLTLTIPSDPEYCRPTTNAFEPFGAEATVLSSDDRFARSIEQAIHLGSRALLRTQSAVHVLERGGTIDVPRSFHAARVAEPGFKPYIKGMDVDGERVMAAVMRTREEPPNDSLLVELSLTSTGVSYARTVLRVDPGELEAVAVSNVGRVATMAEDGRVFLEERSTYSVRSIDDPTPDPKARSLLWTDSPLQPLIATSRNRIHFSSTSIDRFSGTLLRTPTEMSVHVYGLAQDGDDIWGGGSHGFLLRSGGTLDRLTVTPPPRYIGCATAQGGALVLEDDITAIAIAGDHAYLVLTKCSAVAALRLSDRCMSLVSVDGTEPHLVDDDTEGLRAIAATEQELLVTDALGRAFVLSL
jgi:hypothetical protein